MTIAATTRKAGPYTGNGSQTAFPFYFKVFQNTDVLVVLTDTNNADTTQTLTTQYTVSLNGNQDTNPGGTVNMVTAPLTGYKLTIGSQVPLAQTVQLQNNGGFYPTVLNSALDQIVAMVQQHDEQIGRSVKTSISSTTTPDQLLASINTSASNAAASASSAATSASAASTSATNASNSATAAANSAAAAQAATPAGNVNGIVKGNGAGTVSAAVAGTDYLAPAAIGTTVQAFDANTAKLNVAQSFTKAQRGSVVALTDGATITPDFSAGNNFSVTLGGNRTLANPTNITAGQSGVIAVSQDATGSRTLAFGTYWKFASGTAPTLTTTASAVDLIAYYVDSATRIDARFIGDVR